MTTNRKFLFDQITGAGDRVTIVTPHGSELTGRVVMRSSHGGWVLNLGGRYGTPAIADESNVIAVKSRRK